MAPMTRNRSTGNIPGDLVVKYYAQRGTAGLIITEELFHIRVMQ
jgi:N-ethylmaleimide reductase